MLNPLKFFKDKKGHQDLLLLAGDGGAYPLSHPVYKGYTGDLQVEMGARAWAIASTRNQVQCKIPSLNMGYVQFVDEMDVTPLHLFGEDPVPVSKEMINRVAEQVTDDEIYSNLNRGKKVRNLKWLGWVAVILAIGLIGLVFYKMTHQQTDPRDVALIITLTGVLL
jgi:hypothetical protein